MIKLKFCCTSCSNFHVSLFLHLRKPSFNFFMKNRVSEKEKKQECCAENYHNDDGWIKLSQFQYLMYYQDMCISDHLTKPQSSWCALWLDRACTLHNFTRRHHGSLNPRQSPANQYLVHRSCSEGKGELASRAGPIGLLHSQASRSHWLEDCSAAGDAGPLSNVLG